jgi:lipopolysaccharide transport system ATP-binding protein
VGDAEFQKKCLGRMGELVGEKGRTILFVSHNMGAVRSLCQHVVWLDQGHVKMIGPTAEVVESYFRLSEGGSGGRIDVRDLVRPQWLSQRLKIESVELNGGKAVYHGEELRVEFKIEVCANTDGVALGLGLTTMDGTRIITIDSDLGGDRRSLARGNRITVEFSIDQLQLNPGRYLLDIGARSGDRTAVDYLAGCAVIEVLPGNNTPSLLVREGGGVRLPAHWVWHGPTSLAAPASRVVGVAS